jgi:hypothetical protein
LRAFPLAAFALLQAAVAAAQGPPCPEFRVNTTTTLEQIAPAVAADAAGRFVVAWQSDHLGGYPDFDVFLQRLGPTGSPQGAEFQVNTFTTDFQGYPSVASTPAGSFVVIWEGQSASDDSFGVVGRRFDAAGVPQGGEFQANSYTTSYQYSASIGMYDSGGFVVTWTDYMQDGNQAGIFGRRFDAAGVPQGEFQVNTFTTGYQFGPEVAVDHGTSEFVVIWVSEDQDGSGTGVFGQVYDSQGARRGTEFPVNTFTTGSQLSPAVAYGTNGDFLVVWRSSLQDGDGGGIFAQRFDASGARQGLEFRVNAQTAGEQGSPSVTADSADGYVVLWDSGAPAERDIIGRRVTAQGVPVGGDFRVNAYTTSLQFLARVAGQPNRGFAAVWASGDPTQQHEGIYASLDCARLYPVTPCRLADTRNPPGPTGGPPLAANSSRTFPVAAACGIPADATAVALNATAVNATDLGNLRLFPAGQPVPTASSLNFVAGRTRANNATVPLGAGGAVTVQCDMPPGSMGTSHLVLDAYGYYKR